MALIRASFLGTMKPLKEVIESLDRFRGQPQETSETEPEKDAGRDAERSRLLARASEAGGERRHASALPGSLPVPEDEKEASGVIQSAGKEKEPVETSGVSDGSDTAEAAPETVSADQDIWKRTIARVETPLASKLVHTTAELRGDELFLTLNGGHAVFEDSIKSNIKIVEKIASEEAGRRLRIRLTTAHKRSVRKKDLKEKILEEPLIREALELFDGRIVDVAPVDGSENKQNGGENV